MLLLGRKSAPVESMIPVPAPIKKIYNRFFVLYCSHYSFFFESNVEIDFYVPDVKLAIQVSLQVLDDIDTRERETRAFIKLHNFIPESKCLIITNSEEASLECDGIPISVIPAWKWLLEST